MSRTLRRVVSALSLLTLLPALALLAAPAAAAQQEGAPTVELAVTVVGGPGEAERTYVVLCAGDGSATELLDAVRLPIPTSTSPAADRAEGPGAAPHVSYQYQDVGFQLWAATKLLGDDRVQLRATIESSRVVGGQESATASVPPEIITLSRRVDLAIPLGRAVTLLTRPAGGAEPAVQIRVHARLAE